ncbi:MAG: hypothetical protein RQ751_11765 [Longimicrobiales bacterium]|nr:hypothetical protein [Longimicrobiales bacterium]
MVSARPRPSASALAEELRALWRTATSDTIGPALREARLRILSAPQAERPELDDLLVSLEQLEHWLRDR